MRRASIFFAILLCSMWILPCPVEGSGEPPRPVGTVTAIRGQATVTRTTPQPTTVLKFRDPIFSRDRVTTRERSLVRVLYGGKALLTLQESTDVSVTAEPQQTTVVHLTAGTMALALAPAKMKAGEGFEVRTPNAVAAVRGTVILVEVTRTVSASTESRAVPAQAFKVATTFHVISGRIQVVSLAAPRASPVSLGAGLSVTVTEASVGKPYASPPLPDINRLILTPQHVLIPDEVKKAVRGKQADKAVALTEALSDKLAPDEGNQKKQKGSKAKAADPVLLDASQGGAEVILKAPPKAKDQKIQDLKLEDPRENVIIPTTRLPGKTSP